MLRALSLRSSVVVFVVGVAIGVVAVRAEALLTFGSRDSGSMSAVTVPVAPDLSPEYFSTTVVPHTQVEFAREKLPAGIEWAITDDADVRHGDTTEGMTLVGAIRMKVAGADLRDLVNRAIDPGKQDYDPNLLYSFCTLGPRVITVMQPKAGSIGLEDYLRRERDASSSDFENAADSGMMTSINGKDVLFYRSGDESGNELLIALMNIGSSIVKVIQTKGDCERVKEFDRVPLSITRNLSRVSDYAFYRVVKSIAFLNVVK